MQTLTHSKIGGGSRKRLAAMPWYMFIGPPGAGKTTALLNCGLKFPLADASVGAQPLKGVGGTRNCDWWFTDDAVLIDTAGRYTTQDSQAGGGQRAPGSAFCACSRSIAGASRSTACWSRSACPTCRR